MHQNTKKDLWAWSLPPVQRDEDLWSVNSSRFLLFPVFVSAGLLGISLILATRETWLEAALIFGCADVLSIVTFLHWAKERQE
jgi:CHASE2 domain-containing sensor protein